MRVLGIVALVALSCAAPAAAQCLHGIGEDATQKARRHAALLFVRAVNTAESIDAMGAGKKYVPFDKLSSGVAAPAGFEVQFTNNDESYALILKDTSDPCHFVFSTNQNGVIFQGYPIGYEVQPLKR